MSRVRPNVCLMRKGREQCSSSGVGAQNSAEVGSGKPLTIASPDCWAKRRPGRRRRGRSILLSNIIVLDFYLRTARLGKYPR